MKYVVHCDACAQTIYVMEGSEHSAFGRVVESSGPPIVVTIADCMRHIFCSRNCLLTTLSNLPEDALRGGYPLDLNLAKSEF